MKIAITGASGHLGGQVVQQLSKKIAQKQLVALVHNLDHARNLFKNHFRVRQIDFQNKASLEKTFAGIQTLIYIPSKTYSSLARVQELENVLMAVQENQIHNLVAMSFIADQRNNPFVMSPFYGYLPRRLAGTKLNYAIAKNALYADPLVPYLPELIRRKGLIYPVGQAKLSFITIHDAAEALVNLALSPEILKKDQTYLVTQSRSYTMQELGKLLTRVTGRTIGYHPVSVTKFAEIYDSKGDGAELASMYAGGALGMLSAVSDDFAHLTGHEPESLSSFLKRKYRKKEEK